ncbi:hypothetical protein evm_001395 [Chilo suppressalis]|nr:hypothetical protein evm_001395 [Chilo suppressalis]
MNIENISRVPELAGHLLNYLESRETNNLSDEDLASLYSVFGAVLQRAFDILEKHPTLVEYTTSKKTRTLIEVKGENNHCYRVFSKLKLLSLPSF